MKRLTLLRCANGEQGVFGFLTLPDSTTLVTGELPRRSGNNPGNTCIPPGLYSVKWDWSEHLGRKCYRLQNVPGRDGILIHPANFVGDLTRGWKKEVNGCIALGDSISPLSGQMAVKSSRVSVVLFESQMKKEDFELEIKEAL